MQPCKVGLSKQVTGSSLLKFCSKRCLTVASEEDSDTIIPISVAVPAQSSGSLPHPKPDLMPTLTLQFHAERVVDTHLAKNTLVKISLLMDKSKTGIQLFALQQLRTTNYQVVLGFSISEDLSILESLGCYIGNKKTKMSFEKVKQEGYTKLIIEDALMQGLGFCNVQLFIEKHAA